MGEDVDNANSAESARDMADAVEPAAADDDHDEPAAAARLRERYLSFWTAFTEAAPNQELATTSVRVYNWWEILQSPAALPRCFFFVNGSLAANGHRRAVSAAALGQRK